MSISLLCSLGTLFLRQIINVLIILTNFRSSWRYKPRYICFCYILFLGLETTCFTHLGRFATPREMYILGVCNMIFPFYVMRLEISKYLFVILFITYMVIISQNIGLALAHYYTLGLPLPMTQAFFSGMLTLLTAYPCFCYFKHYREVLNQATSWHILSIADSISLCYLFAIISQSSFGLVFDFRHVATRIFILFSGIIFLFIVLHLLQQIEVNIKLNQSIANLQRLHKTEKRYYETILSHEQEALQLQQQTHATVDTMLALLDKQDYPALEAHFDAMLLSSERLRHVNLSGHRVIDAVVGYWQLRSWEKNIEFAADIQIDKIHLDDLDLAIILGNALENAYTAAAVPNISWHHIQVKISTKDKLLLIVCTNSFSGTIKQIGNEIYSSKRQFQEPGTGLANIRLLVEKYDGYINIKYDEQKFTLSLALTNRRYS